MGASTSSYNLHSACPDRNARYQHCYGLFFENRIVPMPLQVTAADPNDAAQVAAAALASQRVVYREGAVVTDPADIALTLQAIDSSHPNYACRDLWEDYKECVNDIWQKKQEEFLQRKEAKKITQQQQQQAKTPAATPPAEKK